MKKSYKLCECTHHKKSASDVSCSVSPLFTDDRESDSVKVV